MRARDLGVVVGDGVPGRFNALTDVAGVRVGHRTLIEGEGPRMLPDAGIDPLFDAVVESVEESIVNALIAARTLTGRDGITAHALPHNALLRAMRAAGRRVDPPSGS